MSRTSLLGVVAAASLCLARSGHADPVSDFQYASQLFLRSATVAYGSSATSVAGINVGKPAGVLAWTVNANQFGIPYDVPITLVLAQQTGNELQYVFNQTISPAIDVTGDGDMLTNLTGVATFMVTELPSDQAATGDVLLQAVPGAGFSTVTATGSWGSVQIPIIEASFVAGYPPSALQSFSIAGNPQICSGAAPVNVLLNVTLDNPAPAGGQVITLQTSAHKDVALPIGVAVPANQTYTVFNATIAPNYVGEVVLTASADGAFGSIDLNVQASSVCQQGHGGNAPMAFNPDQECPACNPLEINDWGDEVETGDRVSYVVQNGAAQPVASLYPGLGIQTMTVAGLSDGGFITGTVEVSTVGGTEAVHAYRSNVMHQPGTLQYLGPIVPYAISDAGTVVGKELDGSIYYAAWDAGNGTQMIAFPRTFGEASSVAMLITERGDVLGTYMTTAGVTNGFRWMYGQAVTELPLVGVTSGIPVAGNASGQIAANGTTSAGTPVAALIDASNNVTLLGEPRGYANFTATSMNKNGWIVGNAQLASANLPVERAFVWSAGTGFVALSGWSAQMPTVETCSQITDDGTVVVYGTNSSGTLGYYTLKL